MRNNYLGVLGYVVLLFGFAVGGLAMVAGASDEWFLAAILAVVAVVLLILAGVVLVLISKREQQDPLAPVMTKEGIERYEQRRESGEV